MLISVVIPVFNKRKSIRNTVLSVLNQTFTEYELIVVDDGSTDGSMDELADIADVRLKRYYKKNTGVSDTRNYAMKLASGRIIAFLDGDDLWDTSYLQRLSDMVVAFPDCALYMQNSRDVLAEDIDGCWSTPEVRAEIKVYSNWEHYFYYRNFKTSALAVNKTKALELNGFDASLTIGEDLDLWLRLILSGTVCFLDEIHVFILKYGSDYHSRFVPEDYRRHLSYKLVAKRGEYLALKDNRDVRYIMNKMIFYALMDFTKDKNVEAVNLLSSQLKFSLLCMKDKIKYVLFRLNLWN